VSVAVGIECEGGVWLGWDSALTDEEGGTQSSYKGKGFKARHVGFAVVDIIRHGQMIKQLLNMEPPGSASPRAVDRWAEISLPYRMHQRCGLDKGPSTLVAVRGRLYQMQEDWSVLRMRERYAAIGSGQDAALGAMFTLTRQKSKDYKGILKTAVAAAAAHCATVSEPIYTLWVPTWPKTSRG